MEDKILVDFILDIYRFKNFSLNMSLKLDENDKKRYETQLSYFDKKFNKFIETENIKIVDLTGENYDPGMAVTPLNIGDFKRIKKFIITQMIEPTILKDNNIIKMGTCLVDKANKKGAKK